MREFAVILAGGSGSRMRGSVSDKVLVPLLGKPVIMHSFGAFVESGRVGKVVFACRDSSQQAAIESAIEKYFPGCGVEMIFCRGGAERGDSVFNGLTALGGDGEIVFIHDGRPPLVGAENIVRLSDAARADGAAVLAARVTDTIKKCLTTLLACVRECLKTSTTLLYGRCKLRRFSISVKSGPHTKKFWGSV